MREILAHFTLYVPEGKSLAAAAHDLEILAEVSGLAVVDCELLYDSETAETEAESAEELFYQRVDHDYDRLVDA